MIQIRRIQVVYFPTEEKRISCGKVVWQMRFGKVIYQIGFDTIGCQVGLDKVASKLKESDKVYVRRRQVTTRAKVVCQM